MNIVSIRRMVVYHYGPLIYYPESRCVHQGVHAVVLSPLLNIIFWSLLDHRDRVVPYERLLEAMFKVDGRQRSMSTLHAEVGKLRKRLRSIHFSDRYIGVEWGRGYILSLVEKHPPKVRPRGDALKRFESANRALFV